MKLNANGALGYSARTLFAVGVAGIGAGLDAHAQDTTTSTTADQGIEITGSRIRRIDTATSDSVTILDRKQLMTSGAATLGDVLQALPEVSGTPFNQFSNNPYAAGTADLNLRGLGSGRTLILMDGQRLNNTDIDAIPANMIERVEVLKEGASAVYGTDAIGGVVNFITRKNFTGVEASATYGETQSKDAATYDGNFILGTKLGRGSAIFGVDYNRQDPIQASTRDASDAPKGYYNDQPSDNAWGSSRSPGGLFYVEPAFSSTLRSLDCNSKSGVGPSRLPVSLLYEPVTRIAGTDGSQQSDFRCYIDNPGPGKSDLYNYQQQNYTLDPTKRYSMFGSAQYPLMAGIKWFASGYYTHTEAFNELAPEPFDTATIEGTYLPTATTPPGGGKSYPAEVPRPSISANSIYNPFDQPISYYFAKRASEVGNRVSTIDWNTVQLVTGLKGSLFDRFDWDFGYSYGHVSESESDYGFLDFSKIFQEIGPSYIDSTGTARCGYAHATIQNCTPVNVIGDNTAFASGRNGPGPALTNGENLSALGVVTNSLEAFDEQDWSLNLSGDLLDLPAGPLGFAAGSQYRALHASDTPDALQSEFELSEANFKATSGGYNVFESYGETHIPIVKNLPGIKSFALNAGVRYARFNTFGSTIDGKYAGEWKPYSDLLIRATYNDVYRAPSSTELYGGAAQSAPGYHDPCDQNTAEQLAEHATACGNFKPDSNQLNTQANGVSVGNPFLKPEKGYSTDFGLVFNPSFYKPMTLELDYWHYQLNDAISSVSLDTILQGCYNNSASAYCGNAPDGLPYYTRGGNGEVVNSTLILQNNNQFTTNGIDGEIKFSWPDVSLRSISFGSFDVSLAVTYLQKYQFIQYDPISGQATSTSGLAGQFDPAYTGDSFPHFKGQAFLFWSKGPFSANITDRYIGNLSESEVDYNDDGTQCGSVGETGNQHGSTAQNPGGGTILCKRNTGYANYVDMSASYALKRFGVEFTLGVNDLFDDGAQQMYNVDLAGSANPLYDIRGRNYFASVSYKFR